MLLTKKKPVNHRTELNILKVLFENRSRGNYNHSESDDYIIRILRIIKKVSLRY